MVDGNAYGEENMASGRHGEREYNSPCRTIYTPRQWNERCRADYHSGDDNGRDGECNPETLENLGDFFEEIRAFDFFLCCCPCHIV